MARAELNDNRKLWEVGQAIVAAWFKVLANGKMTIGDDEKAELQRVFAEIFKTKIKLLVDPVDADKDGVYVVVPQPPDNVHNAPELVEYLRKFHETSSRQYHEELGGAVIFGCGKR